MASDGDWEVTGIRPRDRAEGCPGTITTKRRTVAITMHLPWFMGGDEDNQYETVSGYD